jgi:hypothetical protein
MSNTPLCKLESKARSIHIWTYEMRRRPGRKGGLAWARVAVYSCQCGQERHVLLERSKIKPGPGGLAICRNWLRNLMHSPEVITEDVKTLVLVDQNRNVSHHLSVTLEDAP